MHDNNIYYHYIIYYIIHITHINNTLTLVMATYTKYSSTLLLRQSIIKCVREHGDSRLNTKLLAPMSPETPDLLIKILALPFY